MKHLFVALAAFLAVSCASDGSSGAIYELNTRQFTPEGTFRAAAAELPRLKALGVETIWLMPIQPIGVKERKGSLGSYYAISDYTGFNPEFGGREDFEAFLAEAHRLGLRVILDWVANHTSPDHLWAAHRDWHKRDSMGAMKVQYDWTDISELEYENQDMRAEMKRAMRFWSDTIGVDGFRCDMAMLVPTDFWEEVTSEIRAEKPDFFMLAEAEEPGLTDKAFDAYYGWELHHAMNAVAQGKASADSLVKILDKGGRFPAKAQRLNFTSNHDENSWAGSEWERMGAAAPAMAAFTYTIDGLPLIYTGQEWGNRKRIRFFDKDTVARVERSPYEQMYTALNRLRAAHPALQHGAMRIVPTDQPQKAVAVERTAGNDRVVGVFNFSNQPLRVAVDGQPQPIELLPWAFRFLL